MTSSESKDESETRNGAQFATTRWSLVLAAADSESRAGRQALDDLCRLYWKPVYAFVRTRSDSRDGALDLTQGFFAHVLEKGLLRRADAERGRFRSYLLGSLKHYLANERRRTRTRKRGGAVQICCGVEIMEDWLQTAAPASSRPDQLYDFFCATSLMDEALRLLEEEYARNGR